MLRLGTSGDLAWQKSLGGSEQDLGNDVLQLANGKYVVAGATFSTDGDVNNGFGGYDMWVAQLGADTLERIGHAKDNCVISPNPATDFFEVNSPGIQKVALFSLQGRLVKTFGVADFYELSGICAATYLLKVLGADGNTSATKLIAD